MNENILLLNHDKNKQISPYQYEDARLNKPTSSTFFSSVE